jgi:hypothetical protein
LIAGPDRGIITVRGLRGDPVPLPTAAGLTARAGSK